MSTSILITGHNGFVGRNLVRALQNDFFLFGLDIAADNTPADGVSAVPCSGHSAEEPAAFGNNAAAKMPQLPNERRFSWGRLADLPDTDTIIHLAGKAHDTANTSQPHEYFDVNLGLTKRIFDHFLKSNSKTFIFFSSVKASADTLGDGETLTENHPPDPQTAYGQSKLAAEQYIIKKVFQQSGDAPHLDAVDFSESAVYRTSRKRVFILRPAMIHGPGNKGNLNLLYRIVKKGLPWPLGAFSNLRSFVSMDNVAYLLRQIIDQPVSPGVYNLADDEPVSTNQLIRLMAESLRRKPCIWPVPPGLIALLARAGDTLRLPLNSERLKKLTESYVVSNARIKQALGVRSLPVDTLSGLKKTLASFQ